VAPLPPDGVLGEPAVDQDKPWRDARRPISVQHPGQGKLGNRGGDGGNCFGILIRPYILIVILYYIKINLEEK